MPRMSDAKNRGLIERDEGTESNELDRTIGKWVYGRRERAGAALSNWPNMLSHMEVLFRMAQWKCKHHVQECVFLLLPFGAGTRFK